MNLYVYKILNNILSFLSVVVVFGGTNARTHFGFKHFETESSDKYYCRCDKQFIQLKNSVSICEYLSYYMERFDNILSLQIEYIRTDSVEFFFRLFVHLLKCLFHTLTVRSFFFSFHFCLCSQINMYFFTDFNSDLDDNLLTTIPKKLAQLTTLQEL